MDKEKIQQLTKGNAASEIFKAALKLSTVEEIKQACAVMYGKTGAKARLSACERELRKRGDI